MTLSHTTREGGSAVMFSVLGPLEVSLRGTRIGVGGRRQRALLTFFLCHPNVVVSRDRLVDELLADLDPDSADKVLRVQVSRLRSALSAAGDVERIRTAAGGYVFRLDADECDAAIADARAAEARGARDAGDVRRALALWRDAEALWRGDPFGEFAHEPYARAEAERLSELRELVVEERLETQLRLGEPFLLPELEARVADHPLRERPHAQLMRALHQAGRSAEALEVYRRYRSRLVEDLALEPSRALKELQRSIILGDRPPQVRSAASVSGAPPSSTFPSPATVPTLPAIPAGSTVPASVEPRTPTADGPRLAPRPVLGRPAPRPPRRTVAARAGRVLARLRDRRRGGGLLFLGLGAIAAVVSTSPSVPNGPRAGAGEPPPAGLLVRLDADGVQTQLPLDAEPGEAVTGFGALWVLEPAKGLLLRVDPVAGRVARVIPIGSHPVRLLATSHHLWVADATDHTVTRVDPTTDSVTQSIDLGLAAEAVAVTPDGLWAADGTTGTILRIDPATGRRRAPVRLPGPVTSLTVLGDDVWAASESARTLTRIDAGTGAPAQPIALDGAARRIAAGRGVLWALDPSGATLTRIDPARGTVTATVAVPGRPTDLAVAGGSVLVGDHDRGTVAIVDAARGTVTASRALGRTISSVTADGQVWVAAGPPIVDHRGGNLAVATEFVADSLDPASSNSVNLAQPQFLGLTNDTLVTLDHVDGPGGTRMVPDLALAIPRPQDGGLRYTFQLRPGVRYSTGRPVTARDVPRSLERLFALRSAGAAYYSELVGADACSATPRTCDLSRGVEADDASGTVTFRLTRPDPDFLSTLTMTYAAVLPADTSRVEARDPLPATGPYVITGYTPKRAISLARNPAFREWSTAAQPAGVPDTISMRLGMGASEATAAGAAGAVDFYSSLAGADGLDLGALPDRTRIGPSLITGFFALNVRAAPFDDVRVRQALNLALDRDRIVAEEGGPRAASPTCQILPPGISGYRRYCPWTVGPSADGVWHGPDLARARELVKESGTAGMPVVVWNTPEPHNALVESRIVVETLTALGYRASLKVLPDDTFFTYTNDSRNEAQVVNAGWSADYPSADSFLGKLTCRYFVPGDGVATTNLVEFCDPDYDRAVEQAAALAAVDPEAGAQRYADLDRRLTDLAIWLPTVTPTTVDLLSARVRNYRYHPVWGALIDQFWLR